MPSETFIAVSGKKKKKKLKRFKGNSSLIYNPDTIALICR